MPINLKTAESNADELCEIPKSKICLSCGDVYLRKPKDGLKHWRSQKTCSSKCAHKFAIGRKLSDKNRENIALAKMGDKNPNWVGDRVGYEGVHGWIKRNGKKPEKCENCKLIKPLDLANISQKYLRKMSDWEWLCRKCHMQKDGRLNVLMGMGRKSRILFRDKKGRILAKNNDKSKNRGRK